MKGGGKKKLQGEADGEMELKRRGVFVDSKDDQLIGEKESEGNGEKDRDDEGNGDGEEEEDDGVEEEGFEGEVKGAEGGQEERPKLDEGFFEIEAIRRKRVRKGQLQYLIKWRGWPETSNTWEPLENLQSCSDVTDAFEESLRSGKHGRKRKRKYGGPHTQSKKKQQFSSSETYDLKDVDVSLLDKPSPSAPLNYSNIPGIPTLTEGSELDQEQQNNGNAKNSKTVNQIIDADSGNEQTDERNDKNNYDTKLSDLKVAIASNGNVDKVSKTSREGKPSESNGLANGLAKVDLANLVQNNRCIGSKRRKAGPVKRFKQDPAPYEPNITENSMQNVAIGYGVVDTKSGIAYPGLLAGDSNHIPRANNSLNPSAITKILKPVEFSASVTGNVQDVLVTFLAMRSDGKEVMVDNRYLKANNPLLLINFYEQHLKYSPTP